MLCSGHSPPPLTQQPPPLCSSSFSSLDHVNHEDSDRQQQQKLHYRSKCSSFFSSFTTSRSSRNTSLVLIYQLCILGCLLLSTLVQVSVLAKKSSSSSSGGQKSVKVLLNAKWNQTPLILETAEYLAEENGNLFWSFLEQIHRDPSLLTATNGSVGAIPAQTQYETSIRLADSLLQSASKLDILKFALALRSYSPTVAIFRQFADELLAQHRTPLVDDVTCGDAFVELSYLPSSSSSSDDQQQQKLKRFACSLEHIKQSVASLVQYIGKPDTSLDQLSHPLIYGVDHVYPSSSPPSSSLSSSSSAKVILYANIATREFGELHSFLQHYTTENGLTYVVRYLYPDGSGSGECGGSSSSSSKVALSGYGVELAIKSTEYRQQDDTRVRGEMAPSGTIVEPERADQIAGFVFSKLHQSFPALEEKLNNFHNYLIDTDKEVATLKAWELQEISLQAVTKVLSVPNEEALGLLRDIAQNFPSVARSLVKINVEPELKKEIVKNQYLFMQQLSLGTSDTALFINGLYHDVESVDVFTLFDILRQEASVVSRLHSLLDRDTDRIKKFIKLDTSMEKQDFQIDIRDGAVQYINDIELDRMYRNWPSSLHDLLRPHYPGMLRNIRRNIFHLILVVDPSQRDSFDIIRMAESFYIHKAPVRIGLVFAVTQDADATGFTDGGLATLEAFNYIAQEKSPYDALSFITDVIAYATAKHVGAQNLSADDVLQHFRSKHKSADVDEIFGADSAYDTGRRLAWDFINRAGLNGRQLPKVLMNGVLLRDSQLNSDYFEDAVLTEVMKQTPMLQKAVYKGELQDDDDILDWLMSKPTVMPRLNRVILGMDRLSSSSASSSSSSSSSSSTSTKDKYIDFTGTPVKSSSSSSLVNYFTININDLQATMAKEIRYVSLPHHSRKDSSFNSVTVWFVADLRSPTTQTMFSAALKHLKENSRSMRLGVIFPPDSLHQSPINRVVDAAFGSITNNQQILMQFLQKFLIYLELNHDTVVDGDASGLLQSIIGLIPEEYRVAFTNRFEQTANVDSDIVQLNQAFTTRVLQMKSSSSSSSTSTSAAATSGATIDEIIIILNGKVLHVPPSEPFIEADFALMEKFIINLVSDKVVELLSEKEKSSGNRKCSDLILKLSSVLLSKAQTKTRYEVTNVHEDHSVLVLEPRHEREPSIELIAILDPLTRGAQKITPLLETFYQVFNARIKVYFNAVDKHSDMPLKSYFRFVLDSEPKFDPKSGQLVPPVARFSSMPRTPLFTLGMAVPENWLVEAVDAVYDLDNIHLEHVDTSVVSATFELEHLLVEGHCFEQSTGSPPRGLQFTLGTWNHPVMVDTIVMANLGYFQLKADPGIWLLRLRQGRSDDIYRIVSADGTDQTVANSSEVIAVVSSFRSLVLKIRVNKKPGKQNEELLYDSDNDSGNGDGGGDENNSLWGSFGWSGGESSGGGSGGGDRNNKSPSPQSQEDEDSKRINIFSLASGHLYERLLRIMMVSVLKHTQTPVKFWFLKNYLSPQFKNVLPFMAAKYGFAYELVQYKWPRWLHQQTEKQRIIWGYKILFLDVLFPLDVKKIIFVDADQVVRADLRELRDLSLDGAPYGYTPFCDSRKDMDGFRFWKQGYWATHLHGRKYHISALYVVDLQKFRRIAAGDRLRGQYQGLSQDPNSLSNLDQDLPNNMIHQVSIKSLPQEWLWCETWCDDESKKKAKTIDLCNNPKTKEPKLTSARRIVKEWQSYDNELKSMLDEFQHQQQQQQSSNKKQQCGGSGKQKQTKVIIDDNGDDQQPQQPQPQQPQQSIILDGGDDQQQHRDNANSVKHQEL